MLQPARRVYSPPHLPPPSPTSPQGTSVIDAFELEQRIVAINSLFKNQDEWDAREEDKKNVEAERSRSKSKDQWKRQTRLRDTITGSFAGGSDWPLDESSSRKKSASTGIAAGFAPHARQVS